MQHLIRFGQFFKIFAKKPPNRSKVSYRSLSPNINHQNIKTETVFQLYHLYLNFWSTESAAALGSVLWFEAENLW